MNFLLTLMLFCCLAAALFSAPLTKRSTQNTDFVGEVEHAKSLVQKIINAVGEVHHSCVSVEGFSLDPSAEVKNLDYIISVLAIPEAPKLVPTHTLEVSLNHIAEGIQLHQHLLQEVEGKLTCSDRLSPFLADLRDLSGHVLQVQHLSQVTPAEPHGSSSDLSSRLHSDYQVQAAIHLILQQLQGFGEDVFRTLRHILLTNPPSRG
ncbi:colony stimulating factor 3 (granulocyte) b [Brachyhypopomus gauderio]|uniref:colony stimulating factor 3 (granulocyte) b n=1 Tax=Brachyhypopomus gauderio TaxID=698409 RepID=UPI004041B5D3